MSRAGERESRAERSFGEVSQRVLADRQSAVLAASAHTLLLVEGLSDCFAVEAIAAKHGHALRDEGIEVLPMGGATNIGRFLTIFGPAGRNVGIRALCDAGEAPYVARALLAARLPAAAVDEWLFVCDRDLEDELIRAFGEEDVVALIERTGDLLSLRRLQQMPQHRDRALHEQLHRFMGVRSTRKHRYARMLAEALPADRVPRPLRDLLRSVS